MSVQNSPLMLMYLVCPALIFLITWIRLPIGLPAALLVAAGLFQMFRQPDSVASRPLATRKILWLVLALAFGLTLMGGVGGLCPQSTDYIKHNLLFHDLVQKTWPVKYPSLTGETNYLCYGLGYYLMPALGGKFLGENLLPILTFLWTWAGVALFFYWAATLNNAPGKTLAMILLFAVTGVVWWLFKLHGIPDFLDADGLIKQLYNLGLYNSYNDSFTRFQYQPQHTLVNWLGAAVLYDLLWVKKNPRGVVFVWAACLLWSPLASLGLLLIPLAALKHIPWQNYLEPINLAAGGVLLVILGIYFQGHLPLADSGFIWKLAGDAGWFWYYATFLLLELSSVLMVFFIDRKYQVLGSLRPLFYVSGGALILLPLYKLGYYSDLRQQASGSALLFVAVSATLCWENAAFSVKRPLFILLAATILIGAVYPILRPWENLLSQHAEQNHDFKNLTELRNPAFDGAALQYLGQSNCLATRWLLR